MKKKLTKILLMTLFIAIFSSNFVKTAHALSNDVHDILFDWQYYYNNNSDVAKALGKNQAALRNHYEQYGKREGRAPSTLFNPKYYLQVQSDVKQAFGNDYVAAYNHFVTHGINEGRQGSETFNVSVYKANYSDLRNAFGNNNLLYLKHYREYGISEQRNATSKITSNTSSDTSKSQLITDGYYTIQKGKYGLNVQYAPTSGIGNIVLDPVNDEKNEIFYIQYVKAHKAYYITPYYRSSVAVNALYGASCQSGSQVKAHPSNTNDTASLWYITKDTNNLYHFQNVACKMYITVNGNATTGTALVMKEKQTSNQGFVLNKASTSTDSSPNDTSINTLKIYNYDASGWKSNGNGWNHHSDSGKYFGHLGVDYTKAGSNVPVCAIADGIVVYSNKTTYNGNTVTIKHSINGKTFYSFYAHMKDGTRVAKNKTVKAGEKIGVMGNTGNSTATHLHLGIYTGPLKGDQFGYNKVNNKNTKFNDNNKGYWDFNGNRFYDPQKFFATNGSIIVTN